MDLKEQFLTNEKLLSEYNDLFMRGEMGLDTDGQWPACINVARKNYALLMPNGTVKLTGNPIKSKKLQGYLEDFIDKGLRLLAKPLSNLATFTAPLANLCGTVNKADGA